MPSYTPDESAAIQAYEAYQKAVLAMKRRERVDLPAYPDIDALEGAVVKGYTLRLGPLRRVILDDWD